MPYFDIIFLGIISLIEIWLGIYFLTRYQRSPATMAFGLMSISIGFWVFLNGPILLLDTGGQAFDLLTRLAWIFAILILQFLYIFILFYPYKTENIGPRFLSVLFIPTALFFLLLYFSDSLVKGFENDAYGYTIYGNEYWLFFVYFVFLFLLAVIEGLWKRSKLDGLHKRNMSILLWGIFLSGMIGIINHLVLPYIFHIRYISWIGPGASIIWLGLVGWVLAKK